MSEIVEITTTTETELQAKQMAKLLIDNRMAACVQISGPIHSVYRWQGKHCEAQEFRLSIKSATRLIESLIDFVQQYHPYDTPEILVKRVQASAAYAAWVEEQMQATN